MPNRIIRDAILDSERYCNLPSDSDRLLFLELLLLADDYGLVPLTQTFLARRTTAAAGKAVEAVTKMLTHLADEDLIRVYDKSGARYGFIPRFGNSPRALKPKWPLPDGESLKEINELQKKRIADATQRRANAMRLHTNAPETETETETETEKKRQDAPVRPEVELWSIGVGLLKATGLSDKLARSFLGSMAKTWSDQLVLDACRAAVGKVDPKSYISAFLRDKPKRGFIPEEDRYD